MFVRIVKIFAIITLYVELVKGDCTCCPPIAVTCDPDPTVYDAIDGVFTQTYTNDTNGCTVATLRCTDDTDTNENSVMIDYDSVGPFKSSLFRALFRTLSSLTERL